MARQLMRLGHEVEFMTLDIDNSDWIGHFMDCAHVTTAYHQERNYDLVLCNHSKCQEEINKRKSCPVIRTCHGPVNTEEQPIDGADHYVAVSEEVAENLHFKGYRCDIIRNGIDSELFIPSREASPVAENVLFLTDFEEGVGPLSEACMLMGLNLKIVGYPRDKAVWQPIQEMNDADIVVSLGRGAYEGLMMDRAVLVYDRIGDGWLDEISWPILAKKNCSGRVQKARWSHEMLEEMLGLYTPPKGENRKLALENHNAEKMCAAYLKIAKDLGC